MISFKEQIDRDIRHYQKKFGFMPNMEKDEWAFNFWVLMNIFHVDETLISDLIIDYNDMGIDAFVVSDETNDITLIQNKYYSDGNKISTNYVVNDFLIRAITALENGTYKHSPELQQAFNRMKGKPGFMVHLQLFVTNNDRNKEAEAEMQRWNSKHKDYIAEIFYLDDIKEKYFGATQYNTQSWSARITTIDADTMLQICPQKYSLKNVIEARQVFMPVYAVYEFYKKARMDKYPIFDENIREYLGNKGINKQIYLTLMDESERGNFFYYNNGITIICDEIGPVETVQMSNGMNASFLVKNPQIVNGCQTVNSIYLALETLPDKEVMEAFSNTFVMVKVLCINRDSVEDVELYKKIVKYNNTQNTIDEKTFISNASLFARVHEYFKEHGFLVVLKQSDKYTFKERYEKEQPTEGMMLKKKSAELMTLFGMSEKAKGKLQVVDLSKLLQVVLAFSTGGFQAYRDKPSVLKPGTKVYETVTGFIQNNTLDTLLYLWLLYLRLDETRANSADKRTPVVYYALDLFGSHICADRNGALVLDKLSTPNDIDDFVVLASKVTKEYVRRKQKADPVLDYNHLIKLNIDYDALDDCYEVFAS